MASVGALRTFGAPAPVNSGVKPQMPLLTPLQKNWVLSLFKAKRVLPCVCLREREHPSEQYAIRQITLTSKGVIVSISDKALSPKASSSAELRGKVEALLAQTGEETFQLGETGRVFKRTDLEGWLRVIGQPVLKVVE